jgi:UDP-N-acetylmuramyl pentapeptide phosphotransferase/UDP-N-acetylglucosamine-1-phosphate transferase
MNFNNMNWFNPCTLYWMGFGFILNSLIIFSWRKEVYSKLGIKNYQAIQRIHLNETPRMGGLVLILSILGFVMQCPPSESVQILKVMLISLTPIILVGLKEDLFQDVEPVIRLLSLLLVGWLFRASYIGAFPDLVDVRLAHELLLVAGGASFFYIFSMTAVANGMNLVDGVHGLCAVISFSILISLLFLSYRVNDVVMISSIFSLMLLIIPFILFNYPFGRIFLGDLGAYSLGLIISMLTIILFGRHPEISSWAAALILIYPVTEVVFSLLRRLIRGASIFKPDTLHLHLKLFYFLRPQPPYKKVANALVTPILSTLWLYPLIASMWTLNHPFFTVLAIILFISLYITLYAMVPQTQKKKKKNS